MAAKVVRAAAGSTVTGVVGVTGSVVVTGFVAVTGVVTVTDVAVGAATVAATVGSATVGAVVGDAVVGAGVGSLRLQAATKSAVSKRLRINNFKRITILHSKQISKDSGKLPYPGLG